MWGVDANYEDDDEESEEGKDDAYPGQFKISVNVLMPELWHTLNAQPANDLYPGKGKIYGGIVGNYSEVIAE